MNERKLITVEEYIITSTIGSFVQPYFLKRATGIEESRIYHELFRLVDKDLLSVSYEVENPEAQYNDDAPRLDVSTENIYDYLLGKSAIYDSEYGLERDVKKIFPMFQRIPTKQEVVDAQKQGLTEEERQLLIEAKQLIEAFKLSQSELLGKLTRTIETIATNGVKTGFDRQGVLNDK